MSALAAVYTEWVMKRNNDSLYWQNMQLYTFGVAFNAFGLILGDLRGGDSSRPARLHIEPYLTHSSSSHRPFPARRPAYCILVTRASSFAACSAVCRVRLQA